MNDTRPGYHDMQRQVDRKIGFFMHLAVYLVINSALVLLNFLHNPGRPSAIGHRPWVLGPLLGGCYFTDLRYS